MPIFQSKQALDKQHHISLYSQFTPVLDGINCFSLRFCDNSLLALKMRFQVFSFASKKVQGFFTVTGRVVVIIALSSTKSCLSFLKL